ncbi:hypothetical protein TrLO_g4333 [Triparma laevis f. longispina]|uniref:Uncharacterized protein n=1 Tax=Triparma laevis f. longispina TaxID=1714387 RepID=A0A9W7FMH5_9STRA|nr:hypothetical protein TrLO_g4333 [Triparma laevis f. longispina]
MDMEDGDIPFAIIDDGEYESSSQIDTRRAEVWDERASSKAFEASVASHSPSSSSATEGLKVDIVPLVLETINHAASTLLSEGDFIAPMHVQTPDEEQGVPGQWTTTTQPADFEQAPTEDEVKEMEEWEPEKVPLPAWAVNGRVVGTGTELKDGAEEFSEYARGFADGGNLAESLQKQHKSS